MQNKDALILMSKRVNLDANCDLPLIQALRIILYHGYEICELYRFVLDKFKTKEPFEQFLKEELSFMNTLKKSCKTPPINDIKISNINNLQEAYELCVALHIKRISLLDDMFIYVQEDEEILNLCFLIQASSANNYLPTFRHLVQNHKSEDMLKSFDEFSQVIQKVKNNEFDPSDINKLLNNKNISLLTGLLTGGLSGFMLNNYINENKEKGEK